MSKNLFREASLEKLSSPEQLDERINVTSPKAWLALIAIVGILLSAIVWGFLGSIPTKIEGQGILLNNGGVYSVTHHTSGQVVDIRHKIGDMVNKGEVIARIEVSELVAKINSLLGVISEMDRNGQAGTSDYQAIQSQVHMLREELDYQSQIISPIDGRIVELNMDKGSLIQPGETLLAMEKYDEAVRLEVVIYVPAGQGESVLPGMQAQVSPVTVNKEEYGFLLGRVISVSEYPATAYSMRRTLGNESLVSLLTGQGASMMIRIDLIPDSNTESGYRWSSPKGPPMSIHGGTLVQSAVITDREKPISKIIPLFKSTDHERQEVKR